MKHLRRLRPYLSKDGVVATTRVGRVCAPRVFVKILKMTQSIKVLQSFAKSFFKLEHFLFRFFSFVMTQKKSCILPGEGVTS